MTISKKEIEVRYSETDQMGVVYHANYLVWFELGLTQLVKDLGFDYMDMEREGIISPVLDVQITYKKPAKYGDKVFVETWIDSYDGIKTIYGYRITNEDGEIHAEGHTTNIIVKKDTLRPVSLKKTFPEWHNVYEKNANVNRNTR